MKLCKVVINDSSALMTSSAAGTYYTATCTTPLASFVCPAGMLATHLERALDKVIANGPKTRELSVSLTEIDIDDQYIVEGFRK